MKLFAAYLLASVALVAGTTDDDASLRGSGDLDLTDVERQLKNACKHSKVEFDTFSKEKCYSRCACQACKERGGGVCCVPSCNPQVSSLAPNMSGRLMLFSRGDSSILIQTLSFAFSNFISPPWQCDPENPPCADGQVHKYCYDKKLCKKCKKHKKKGDCYHCDKNLPPCEGPCFANIDDCQEEVQCPLGCGTGCAQEGTAQCHKCCLDKHPAFGASCKVDVRQSCKNECNQVYRTLGCSF